MFTNGCGLFLDSLLYIKLITGFVSQVIEHFTQAALYLIPHSCYVGFENGFFYEALNQLVIFKVGDVCKLSAEDLL